MLLRIFLLCASLAGIGCASHVDRTKSFEGVWNILEANVDSTSYIQHSNDSIDRHLLLLSDNRFLVPIHQGGQSSHLEEGKWTYHTLGESDYLVFTSPIVLFNDTFEIKNVKYFEAHNLKDVANECTLQSHKLILEIAR